MPDPYTADRENINNKNIIKTIPPTRTQCNMDIGIRLITYLH